MAVPVDPELQQLLNEFVCVRTVQMWGLDLDKYQFDGFLTWAVFFLNADGTIYGRYGSRSESGHDAESDKLISVEGFKKTLRRAIGVHQNYLESPAKVGRQLAAKTGPKRVWKHAQDIPKMSEMFRTKERFSDRANRRCIHCHMVPRAELASLYDQKLGIPDQTFWHFPLPQDIGVEMDPKEVSTVLSLEVDSMAARAGLEVGDEIESINGQPILSIADIQWVLHHAKDPDVLRMIVQREGQSNNIAVPLDAGWRLEIDDWRYLNELMQGYLVNFRAHKASPLMREKLGLEDHELAFELSWVNQWRGRPISALQAGDVIIGINGSRKLVSVAAFTARLFRESSGRPLQLTVIRDGQTKQLKVDVP